MKTSPLFLALLLFSLSAGCQQSTSSRLIGTWEGRPDTAAAAAERSAKLKAKHKSEAGGDAEVSNGSPSDANGAETLGATLLEEYDVAIRIELESSGETKMELAGDESTLIGVWRVVAELPPNGAEIEISLLEGDKKKVTEKRRFLIDFQENGESPGFTLREKGADPKFGRLYFTRVKE